MYKYTKMRILSVFTANLIILSMLLSISAGAVSTGYGWYCMHAKDHKRPQVDGNLSWISEYDGYYLDPKCNDSEDEKNKVIYLTFDVGYENGNVGKVLDILKQEQVPGAFFVLAHVLEKETALVERMFDEGHLVCNHTAHHKDMSAITDRKIFEEELTSLEQLCLEKTGKSLAKYYRPPEGRFSRENMQWSKEMGYKTVFWSFGYADWDNNNQPKPAQAIEKIMSNIHNGAVLLLHPTSATNAEILDDVIRQCRSMGYRFGTLDELTV